MANFETPFASQAARRSPTADEKANGFPCGAADQTLFNGMFHRIEAELGNLIAYAGLVGTDSDLNQVRKSIVTLIEAATGGGETENYLQMAQVIARLPLWPEIQSADGRINITSPANGIVRVPGGINMVHRGVNLLTSVQTDFNTVASRTYHLRWNGATGLELRSLGDNGYNPDGLAEDNVAFDTTYDSALLARVTTNSGNVATITPLSNKQNLKASAVVPTVAAGLNGTNGAIFDFTYNVNFARTPEYLYADHRVYTDGPVVGGFDQVSDADMMWPILTQNRYTFAGRRLRDMTTELDLKVIAVA